MQSFYIKCGLCGKVTKVNISQSLLNTHPINIPCLSCKASLCGEVLSDNRNITLNFINADVVDEKEDYTLNYSGEYPSVKTNLANDDEDLSKPFTTKLANIEKFYLSLKEMQETRANWLSYKKIFDLNLANYHYVSQKESEEEFDFKKEDDILRTVHHLEHNALTNPIYLQLHDDIKIAKSIYQLDFDELISLINYVNNRSGYTMDDMDKDIIKIYDGFVKRFSKLTPAFSLFYLKHQNFDYSNYYSSTSDFDDVKDFYLETYDIISKLIVIPILLNNIMYRFKYSYFTTVGMTKITIDEFVTLPNEENFKYCSELEHYTSSLKLNINHKLVKALKKGYYEVDKVNQIIMYRVHHKDYFEKISLLEMEKDLIVMINATLEMSEYIFRIRQVELIDKDVRKGEVKTIESVASEKVQAITK